MAERKRISSRPNGSDPTVWMRALRYHRPHGKPVDEGDVYLTYEEEVENLQNLGFAVRDIPPPAPRWPTPSSTTTQPPRDEDA